MSHKTLLALILAGALFFLPQRGVAEDAPTHQGSWPVQNGFNRQPTGNDQDVTSDQAREIDRLYDQLLSSGDKTVKERPRLKRAR